MYQANTVVGDVAGNTRRCAEALEAAEDAGAQVFAGPELLTTGYPPEDLLLKPELVAANLRAVEAIAARTGSCLALIGFVDVQDVSVDRAVADLVELGRAARQAAVKGAPRRLRNALAVCARGELVATYHKRRLPNYGVFDEQRWFGVGDGPLALVEVGGARLGVSICEDLWFADGPVPALGRGGADLVVNVNASPFSVGRMGDRLAMLRQRAAEAGCPVVYVNQVGGQDELVFDGGSVVVSAGGAIVGAAPRFAEAVVLVDVPLGPGSRPVALPVVAADDGPSGADRPSRPRAPDPASGTPAVPRLVVEAAREPSLEPDLLGPVGGSPPADEPEVAEVYAALVLGTRDYVRKNGFHEVVIGLSGGIDSSLVATVAVDALGAGAVHGVAMPSRYSSAGSLADAAALAERLGIDLATLPIEPAHRALAAILDEAGVAVEGLTDENLQSRIRGVLLMALSNARGWLVLTTGNKSELATGYSTLYGDTAGGFAVIKDVAKTMVYRLCRFRNALAGTPLVPDEVLVKPPSAELRPGQRDDQSLPPYELLDPLVAALVEEDRPVADLVAEGVDASLVERVARLVDGAEYKRRQSPLGIRITPRAFGRDRRMPITHRFVGPTESACAARGGGEPPTAAGARPR
jgi:NAD+ synthase (glutamine-hydrolysing)